MLINIENNKQIKFISQEYFITYERKPFTYKISSKEDITEYLNVSNKLYKINFNNFSYELVYEFENPNGSYLEGSVDNNYYYCTMRYIKKGSFIFEGGYKTKYYKLSLSDYTLSKYEKELFNKNPENENIIKYKDYIYYFEEQSFGPLLGNYKGVYFYKKHINKTEPILMQFFVCSGDNISDHYDGTRYSSLVWNDGLGLNNNDFMILDY